MVKYHIGIDVSKRRHRVCIHDLAQDSYSGTFSIEVNRQGFKKLINTLEKLSTNKEDFVIGIEATGSYGDTLSYYLLPHSYKVVEINPYQANQFRKAQGKKAKTDSIDARSLAAQLALGNHKALAIPDPVLDNLRELTRFRADMVKDCSALVNQLHETLSSIFPELATVFSQLNSPSSIAFLIAYPGPEYILGAGEAKTTETLLKVSRGMMGKAVAKSVIAAAQTSIGVMQRQPALTTKVSILGERITSLKADIKRVEKEIADLFQELPYKPEDFPAGDISSLATLISEIEDIHRFPTLKQFLSHYGWCPQSFQTGSYNREHPRMSHAGNRYVRRIIWMLSIGAIRNVPRYRDYFQRRVNEGKSKMHVIVAVARKLLSVLYAILKKGIPYDPDWEVNRHLAMARH